MDFVLEIINYILIAILIAVSATWISLIRSMIATFRDAPYLDRFEPKEHNFPRVSVILPARNEEKFIEKCLDSLVNQDYENYEIIEVNQQ